MTVKLPTNIEPDRLAPSFVETLAKAGSLPHTCPRCGFVGQMLAPPLPAPASRSAPAYRVVRGGSFVWSGAVCIVKAGDVVHLRNYGEAGIANMRGRGIVLEPV